MNSILMNSIYLGMGKPFIKTGGWAAKALSNDFDNLSAKALANILAPSSISLELNSYLDGSYSVGGGGTYGVELSTTLIVELLGITKSNFPSPSTTLIGLSPVFIVWITLSAIITLPLFLLKDTKCLRGKQGEKGDTFKTKRIKK